MTDNNGATPPKRASARAQVYIEVNLADGQKFIFDVDTATELQNELYLAVSSLTPPEIAIGSPPEDPQNPEPS